MYVSRFRTTTPSEDGDPSLHSKFRRVVKINMSMSIWNQMCRDPRILNDTLNLRRKKKRQKKKKKKLSERKKQ